jgi:hypothetical protein
MERPVTTENKPYLIVIYGKDGCEKCARLKLEVNSMLEDGTLAPEFGMDYQNLSTANGMAAYALAETVNGQRIPALQIMKYSGEKNLYAKIPDPRPEKLRNKKDFFVPVYLQLQTEYGSNEHAISRADIAPLIALARECP